MIGLEAVLVTPEELHRRPSRMPDYQLENRALTRFAQALADAPHAVLQILVETSLELCRGESAGISILERGVFFRWHAVAGAWSGFVDAGMPRSASPCGTVLDRDSPLLFANPGLHFPDMANVDPLAAEALLVPFRVHGVPVGTVWVVTHSPGRTFEREDERLLTNVSSLAAAAYQTHITLAALRESEHALREADRRKDQFLATLSHELRSPLAPLSNLIDILQLKDTADSGNAPVFEIMERQVTHIVRLVDDLLELSRIAHGKIVLERERVELADIVERALEASQPALDRVGHRVTVAMPTQRIVLDADPTRLTQVVSNLLNNAAKYTPSGGDIWLTLSELGDEAVISVRDSGIGIEAAMLPRVFEMFTQVVSGRGGLGIGLGLTRALLELHGGRIDATSAGLGHGSEFVVHLPLAGASVVSVIPASSH